MAHLGTSALQFNFLWRWTISGIVLGKLSVAGCPTDFDNSRTKICCVCGGYRWGLFDIFSLVYDFSLLSPAL